MPPSEGPTRRKAWLLTAPAACSSLSQQAVGATKNKKTRQATVSESFAGHLTSNRLPALPSGIGRERRGTRTPYRRWWIGREPLASYATETRPKPRLQAGLFLWPFLLLPSEYSTIRCQSGSDATQRN